MRSFVHSLLVARKLLSAIAVVAIALGGCSSGSFQHTSPPPIISIVLNATSASLEVSGTTQFTATVANAANTAVTWQVNGVTGGDATHGMISASGLFTAPASVPSPAIVTVTAIAQADSTKTATAQVTITAAPVVAVTVAPLAASIQVNHTQIFTATVSNDSQNKGVTWALSGTGCTGVACGALSASSSASGAAITYTAPASVPSPAAVSLTATSVADGTKISTATITVMFPPAIAVAVAPLAANVQAGAGTKAFTATVANDTQNLGVTWALSGAGCGGAGCGTLSAIASGSGVAMTYTAPASVPTPAVVTLTATSVSDTTKSGSATITVTAPPAIVVTVSPLAANVQAGIGSQAFTATVTNDSQNKGVTWTLTGAGCAGATCGTLSQAASASGTAVSYSAPRNLPSPAVITITAASVADVTRVGTATITVSGPVAVSVVPNSTTVQTGQTQSFTANVSNDALNQGVTWALTGAGCSGPACGTISASASASGAAITYTAPAALPTPAAVTLTATSVADSTRSNTATITVTAAPTILVSVAPTTQNVQAGVGTHTFTATVTNDSQNKGVSWTLSGAGCSGATCGTLSAATSASGTPITYTAPANAPSPATVSLTATSLADGAKLGTATITVTAGISLSVAPVAANVQAKIGTKAFAATVANDLQSKGVTWALSGAGCSGATCGTLSAASSASGVAITYTAPAALPSPATVTLMATSVADATKQNAATITVTAAVAVSVSPAAPSVQVGQTQGITATVTKDALNQGVTWALTGAGCAGATCGTISATSSASGVAITYTAPVAVPTPATVTLTATSVTDSSKGSAATITVTPSTGGALSVTLTPVRGGMTSTGSQVFTATVTNDIGSAGVTWTKSAGTFSSQNTAAATYVAPSTAGSVTVTATSIADGSKTATATIGVTDLAGVTTYHNNLSRDGANTQEYALTTANVNTTTFGKLFSCATDGAIYAQPLWVANFTISGVQHNIVFAATEHDSLYAFDADASPCITLWHANLVDTAHGAATGESSVPSGLSPNNLVGGGSADVASEVGITGTPVIDLSTATIYVVSKSVQSGTNFFQRLHALDLATGAEKFSGPVLISGSVSGTGDGSSGGIVTFSARKEFQRSGLALVNGVVYVTFASHEDNDPYHGWIIGYDKTSLARVAVFNDTPNGYRGGIWMAGGAPAADGSNNLYVITGNGDYSGDGTTNTDYGDSFLKLSTASGISVTDWFTPSDQSTLDGNDTDFGSGGAAILVDQPIGSPHTQLVIGGGKQGNLFLLDRTSMGRNNSTNQVVQTVPFGNAIFATAAFWQNNLYLAGIGPLKQFVFNPGTGIFATAAATQSSSSFGFPGATPSVSAQGASNGIVWATNSSNFGLNGSNPSRGATAAVLHAFDATSLTTDLWNSSQAAASRDKAGNCVKFTVPTVANGRIYIGTRGNDTTQGTSTVPGEIDVYGLLPN